MKVRSKVPLSGYAESRVRWAKSGFTLQMFIAFGGSIAIWTLAHGISGIFTDAPPPIISPVQLSITGIIVILDILFLWRCLRERKSSIQCVLEENARDYQRSLQLQEVVTAFSNVMATDYPVMEEEVGGPTWRPFRVERILSSALHGQLEGNLELEGYGFLIFRLWGTMQGVLEGKSVPNLLDSSTMIFFEGPHGETLRVLVPSPQAIKELFLGTLRAWCGSLPLNCHTRQTLESYSLADQYLLHPISHPQTIDALDASCQKALDQRPQVKVIGEKLQDGVVLATALEVYGQNYTFLPSGFFRAIADRTAPLLGPATAPPKLLTALS